MLLVETVAAKLGYSSHEVRQAAQRLNAEINADDRIDEEWLADLATEVKVAHDAWLADKRGVKRA